MDNILNIYESERTCEYRGETYHVRDNGSIFRLQKPNKRKRPLDEKWTFGNPCNQKGYMNFSSETVHRIVATAFHGKQPSEKHIVDHIDTNKKNNRPENLRWITRLENILLNPITLSRIIFKYGSIDNFLTNPSNPIDGELEQNFDWMRTVTKEESDNTRNNLLNWAKEGKIPSGGQLGEWIFNQEITKTQSTTQPNYIISKTPNAAQRIVFHNDKPNEFPCTPQIIKGNPLATYFENLKVGMPFFRNHNGDYVIVKSGFSKDRQSIYVLTRSDYVYREIEDGEYTAVPINELNEQVSIKDLPHSLSEVTYVDNLFLHSRVETGFHPREELEDIFAEYTQELE
ncbi:HNH endonuclease [Winogradskyella echinorum]|uniref:HNH endonuclease n=1 Tax=Winogradskyella echinorum TaxID=538189 RepID=A0ABR6Y2J0_9FLAO|nr:HNH endonuclease signature motif containing protein [Winogradskyella echinorum]MBC3846970.1 HNH endonuclease [Winogradskyella echinorum]MBC5751318.1 HNH endonuclease [Winogradskyella echinorum]